MKLFLSYPSAERALAERLALALEAEGHDVFFDRHDLPEGGNFHQRLREALEGADAMVFLVTPAAVAAGSYTLAELDLARRRWRRPGGHVLPVMVQATPMATLPPYLSAVTVLQPQGETVAETVAAVTRLARLQRSRWRGRRGWMLLLLALVLIGAVAAGWLVHRQRAQAAALAADAAAATQALQLCEDGHHEAALARLNALVQRQPALPAVAAARQDCAMAWMRGMRAVAGPGGRSFDDQVALLVPVLVEGLSAAGAQAHPQRAADLRAHLGWGEALRRREGAGAGDPLPHWQRALADDPGNVYAHTMWGRHLLPGRVDEARPHFEQALASGRERPWVRRMQLGGSLGGGVAATVYAIEVADAMRQGQEPMPLELAPRLWTYGYAGLLDAELRDALFAAVPPAQALATYDQLFAADPAAASPPAPTRRLVRALLQARAGQQDQARAALEALLQQHARDGAFSARIVAEARRELALLTRAR